MERKAHYALIGLFTFAVVAGAFGFVFWLHHSSGKNRPLLTALSSIVPSPVCTSAAMFCSTEFASAK